MKTQILFNGKVIHTVIHPRSVTSPAEARQDTRDKITVIVIQESESK